MWIVSLDEYGKFEQHEIERWKKKGMLVGGSVFICQTKQDAEDEAKRLEAFYRQTCMNCGCVFPNDMHYLRDRQNHILNEQECVRVKKALSLSLSDFLQGKGEWKDQPPRGQYWLYAIVSDAQGMGKIHNGSNLLQDSVASNRYEHMAYRVIKNLLFYHIHANDDDIRLDLATRVYNTNGSAERLSEAQTLGVYSVRENLFRATSTESYRSMLVESMLDSRRSNIQFDLKVQSINYDCFDLRQAFLYLADTICSDYENAIFGAEDSGAALSSLISYGEQLLGKGHSWFWAYHETDTIYREIYQAFERKEDFHALKAIYSLRKQKNSCVKSYDVLWLRELEEEIIQKHAPVQGNVVLLDEYIHSKGYDLDVAFAIERALEQQADQLASNEENARYLCALGKAKMTLLNHTGQHELAGQCYEKTMKLMHYLPMEDVIDLRNMLAVSQQDALEHEKAFATTKETIEYVKMISEIKDALFPGVQDRNLMKGRTVSQFGQCHAFLGRNEEAIALFHQAIEAFGDNQNEIDITRSYALHAYIEARQQKGYEAEALLYFGSSDLEKQFQIAMSLGKTARKFTLYIYMKALFLFYRNDLSQRFVRNVVKQVFGDYRQNGDGHPWELILKYGILLYESNFGIQERKFIDEMIREMENSVDYESSLILERIMNESKAQIAFFRQQQKDIAGEGRLGFMYQ